VSSYDINLFRKIINIIADESDYLNSIYMPYELKPIVEGKLGAHELSIDKAQTDTIVKEINKAANKKNALVDLLICIEDSSCFKQCVVDEPQSPIGCYSKFYDTYDEL
jgi:hypothetical protein